MNKILIVGNSKQVNNIDFNRLNDHLIIVGINRLWRTYIPEFLFFNDFIIYDEIEKYNDNLEKFKNCSFLSSDWIFNNLNPTRSEKINKLRNNGKIKILQRKNRNLFPDSVTCAILTFQHYLLQQHKNTFYIAGVDLKYDNKKNHFWTNTYEVLEKHNKEWYDLRFKKILNNFLFLKSKKFNIISVNENSELNKYFKYQQIERLYT